MNIRPIKNNEIMLLTDFLYEAIFQRDKNNFVPRTIIQEPALWIYINEFGAQKDDYCFVAEIDNIVVGAVWVRCIRAYGYIDDTVPEFAISIYPQYRGKGIGTALLQKMLEYLQSKGYAKTSLVVQKDNYAVKMYQNVIIMYKREVFFMPQIRPITDLRNTNEISDACHAVNEPIFITKNGYGDLVVMSIETYEQIAENRKIDDAIEEAETEYQSQKVLLDATDTLVKLRRKHLG